jgi:hypothetical protein
MVLAFFFPAPLPRALAHTGLLHYCLPPLPLPLSRIPVPERGLVSAKRVRQESRGLVKGSGVSAAGAAAFAACPSIKALLTLY